MAQAWRMLAVIYSSSAATQVFTNLVNVPTHNTSLLKLKNPTPQKEATKGILIILWLHVYGQICI